jgi:hypothetical protein
MPEAGKGDKDKRASHKVGPQAKADQRQRKMHCAHRCVASLVEKHGQK